MDNTLSVCVLWGRSFVWGHVSWTETNRTLCAEPKLHWTVLEPGGPHSAHSAGINSARQTRLLAAHFWKQACESVFRASVWMYERGGGVCVQEIKNSSAPQPAAEPLLEAGKGTSSPGRPTPPKALWEIGWYQENGGATLSRAFSGQTSSVCTDNLISPALTALTCSFFSQGLKAGIATSNWPITISQYSAGCLKAGPSEGPSGTHSGQWRHRYPLCDIQLYSLCIHVRVDCCKMRLAATARHEPQQSNSWAGLNFSHRGESHWEELETLPFPAACASPGREQRWQTSVCNFFKHTREINHTFLKFWTGN